MKIQKILFLIALILIALMVVFVVLDDDYPITGLSFLIAGVGGLMAIAPRSRVLLFVEQKICRHRHFTVSEDQLQSSGYAVTLDKKCTTCGAHYIFRRESEQSQWYRWSKR